MLEKKKFQAENLRNFWIEASKKMEEDRRNKVRSICLTSTLDMEELLEALADRFSISSQGEFYELKTSYEKYGKEIEVYLYLYMHSELNYPIFSTLNSSGDINRTIEPIIKSTEEIYYLWMPPGIVESLKEDILEMGEKSKLTYFYGKKFSSERRFEEERRPEYKRKDEYEGDDAVETLEERKKEYGITPTRLQFEIYGKGEFLFNNIGGFVLARQTDPSAFDTYEKIIDLGLEKVKRMNNAIQSSELTLVEKHGIKRLFWETLEIEVEKSLDYEDSERFLNELKENEFHPYNINKARGSLLLGGRIVDQENGGIISLSTDGKTFSVVPKYDTGFDTLMRFYRFMVERIDSDAAVRA